MEGNDMKEGRGRPEGCTREKAKGRTQRWQPLLPNLQRVHAGARKSGQTQFTALLHHVDTGALERAYWRLRKGASPGVDGMTMEEYQEGLDERLQRLHEKIHRGQYWPKPAMRRYIPKADGGERPLGIPALEDKIVQGAVAEVLNAIYEADFLGFSYGFRPGRSQHQALAALERGLMTQKVNWVLDVDIRKFFDSVDHEWMMRMVTHRITDPRIHRLIRRWLKAGVLEGGRWEATETGTPQGSGISPLLANLFLHYAFDLWIHRWRRREATGQVIVCRYADDVVIGFQTEGDARTLMKELKARLEKFGLALHEGKTKLIEFGRYAAENRARAGLRRPETFNFLGFTHYCGRTRSGKFIVKRKTQSQRITRKLREVRVEMKRRLHEPVKEQHKWLSQVLRGHYGYYGVIFNYRSLNMFYENIKLTWLKVLRLRSQKSRMNWQRFNRLMEILPLPRPRVHQCWQS
jgi:RNA-directed DNA polymerase